MLRAVEREQRCERGHVAHIFGARTCTQRTEQTRVPGPGPVQVRGVQGCVVAGKLCKLKSGISVALTRCLYLSLSLARSTRSTTSICVHPLPLFFLLPSLTASLRLRLSSFRFNKCFVSASDDNDNGDASSSLSVCKNYAETEATKGKPQLSEEVCVCVCVCQVCVCVCVCRHVCLLQQLHLPLHLEIHTVNGCGIGTIQFSLLN